MERGFMVVKIKLLPQQPSDKLSDTLNRLQRGIVSYIGYLHACGMESSFSEYVLYEPALRILTHCGFVVQCEYPCPNIQHAKVGDKKRLDLYATHAALNFDIAIEIKWFETGKEVYSGDEMKLKAFVSQNGDHRGFFLAFGTSDLLSQMKILPPFQPIRSLKHSELKQSSYACQTYEVV